MTPELKIDEANRKIYITLDMCEPRVSTSEKSVIIASTQGHSWTGTKYNKLPVAVNVNVYIPNKET